MTSALALQLRDVTVRFEGQAAPAVDGVSFDLEEGRIAMLIGPNGSGKSTLVRAILGLVRYEGEIRVFGRPVKDCYGEIGYVPQRLVFDLTLPLTAAEAIRMPLGTGRNRGGQWAYHEVVETMGIAGVLGRPLGVLSGGQLKRVLLARAMITSPRLLLLDEPEAGVDVEGEETLYQLLERLVTLRGLTVLVCSHELELVFRYARQVLCINRRLLCSGPPAEVLTEETLDRLYGPSTAGRHPHHHPGFAPGHHRAGGHR